MHLQVVESRPYSGGKHHQTMTTDYGKRLRTARVAAGLTQRQLAEAVGVKQPTIAEAERSGYGSKFTVAIARELGVSPYWLESGDGPMELVKRSGAPENKMHSRNEDVRIPLYDTGGRMGEGGIVVRDQPGVIKQMIVSPEWVRMNLHRFTALPNLVVVTGFGDSMQPMYNPGDPLIVDTGVRSVDIDGVFFFRVGEEGFIKRLQRIPGQGVLVISENPKYRDWTITKDMDFQVFGRVIKAWKSEDF